MRLTALLICCTAFAGCSLFGDPDDVELTDDTGVAANDGGTASDGGVNSNNSTTDGGSTAGDGGSNPSDGGETGPDLGGDDDMDGDDMGSGPVGSGCGGPALADTTDPDRVVGTGSPDSCTEAALRTAVEGGGIITFNCGNAAHVIELSAPLDVKIDATIDGEDRITLSGGNASRIFVIDVIDAAPRPVLHLQRMRLSNGFAEIDTRACGGAIYRHGGMLTVVDVDFIGNTCAATGDIKAAGGAIYADGTQPVEIAASRFTNNTADDGGAVWGINQIFRIYDSEFIGNSATNFGGAVSGLGGQIHICGSTFSNNTTDSDGGAVFYTKTGAAAPLVVIEQSQFVGNSAGGNAGGLYTYGSNTEVYRSVFYDNQAAGVGGFRFQQGDLTLENSTFVENIAKSSVGGAFKALDETGRITNCTFVANESLSSFGGAIHDSASLTLSNSLFAQNYGGNVYEDQSCSSVLMGGGGNIQWPDMNPGGEPEGKCSPDVTFDEPMLGAYDDALGIIAPEPGSPALGAGMDCPDVDQLGNPRPADGCTSGAYEVP